MGFFFTTLCVFYSYFTTQQPHHNPNNPRDHGICGALSDLVACAQFKKREKQPWRSVTFSLLKVTPLHGCFSRFLSYTNGTKSRKAPHISRSVSLTNQSGTNSKRRGSSRNESQRFTWVLKYQGHRPDPMSLPKLL